MTEPTVGIVVNPASGRDIRRLVAKASVFPTAEKANMVQRLLTALASAGVTRALLSTDLGGISAAVLRALRTGRNAWPAVEFCEDPLTDSAQDTTNAVRRMVAGGAGVVVCLGGDGTARVAAAACGDVPLLPLSTGTNNAFPQLREATVAGLAAGLVATGSVDATRRASVLEVTAGQRTELALVDVCGASSPYVGSRALWEPAQLTELYCTFAEPDAIGLSSVAGQLCPSPRDEPGGVALRFAPLPEARWIVRAPIAPGLVVPVGVRDWRALPVGEPVELAPCGVVAVDGERELELRDAPASVRLRADGPRCVDVTAALTEAASRALLTERNVTDDGHLAHPGRTRP
ncbi:ATP-NAD kinase family protein [Amycolatopsis sacchari]|uniref:ATP-NAD kinase family protein n=1 Tax=Amycolatopsis sacchari TaxID=115433 RepID=UPI003D76399E